MEVKATFAGLDLEHPIMNAAGAVKTLEEAKAMAETATSVLIIGSISAEERFVNPGQTYWPGHYNSLNSLGIPNRGKPYYDQHLPTMVKVAHDNGKPLILSVAGSVPMDFVVLTELGLKARVDAVEVNYSCPNKRVGGQQHPMFSYRIEAMEETNSMILEKLGSDFRIGAKLSPYADPIQRLDMAKMIAASPLFKFVTLTNTIPNGFNFDDEGKPAITATGGYAGIGGPALKSLAMAHVRLFREVLPAHIDVIGVGGIETGRDVLEYMKVGASAVQVATAYHNRGGRVFRDLLMEFTELALS